MSHSASMIHYDLIGTKPSAEANVQKLPEAINTFLAWVGNSAEAAATGIVTAMECASLISDCAAHFYGLSRSDFKFTTDLIDAMISIDQDQEAK